MFHQPFIIRYHRKESSLARRKRFKHKYRSNFEAEIAADLDAKRVPYGYETLKLEYWLKKPRCECSECGSGEIIEKHHYTPDFILFGGLMVIEAKGRFTPRNRKTMAAIKEQYPEIDLRMVFMEGRDNYLTKNHGLRYSDWCDRYGIPYAFGLIPEEWLR